MYYTLEEVKKMFPIVQEMNGYKLYSRGIYSLNRWSEKELKELTDKMNVELVTKRLKGSSNEQ